MSSITSPTTVAAVATSTKVAGSPVIQGTASNPADGAAKQVEAAPLDPADIAEVVTGTTRRRFLVLALFLLYGVSCQMHFVSFSPIVRHVEARTGASALLVSMLMGVVSLAFVIALAPSLYVLRRFGLRHALVLGSAAGVLGAVPKFAAIVWWPEIAALLVCQFLIGVAQASFFSMPAQVAATWFPVAERTLATAIGTLASFLGMGLGFLVPPLVVSDSSHGDAAFGALFGAEAVLAVAAAVGIALFVPAAPELPPSVTAPQVLAAQALAERRRSKLLAKAPGGHEPIDAPPEKNSDHAGLNSSTISTNNLTDKDDDGEDLAASQIRELFAGMWALRRNKDYALTATAFGLFNGFFMAFSNVLAQAVEPISISERHIGIMVFCGLIGGSFAAVGFGLIVDRFRRYKVLLLIVYAVLILDTAVCAVLVQTNALDDGSGGGGGSFNQWLILLYAVVLILATFNCGSYPVAFEFFAELTHPTAPIMATTPPLVLNNIMAFLMAIAMSAVLGDTPTRQRSVVLLWTGMAFLVGLVVVLVFFVTEHRRRHDEEEKRKALSAPTSPA